MELSYAYNQAVLEKCAQKGYKKSHTLMVKIIKK